MNDMATLGSRITGARNEAGLTQQGLADAVGRSVHAIRKWERDENEPSIELLTVIGEVTGVSLSFLVGDAGSEGLSEAEKTRAALARIHRRIECMSDATGEPGDMPKHAGVEALADSELFRREYQPTDDELHMLRHCVISRSDGSHLTVDTINGAVALLEAIRRAEAAHQ